MTQIHYQSARCRVFWVSQGSIVSPQVVSGLADELTFITGDPRVDEATHEPGEGEGLGGWLASETGESDVLYCSWNKDTQNPCGVMQVHLKSERPYHNTIQPGDILYVYMSYQGETQQTISSRTSEGFKFLEQNDYTLISMVFVDRVESSRMVAGTGATTLTVVVSARDFGKVFTETQVFFDPSMNFQETSAFTSNYWQRLMNTGRGSQVMSPVENVLNILDVFYNLQATENLITGQQWMYPGTLSSLDRGDSTLPLIRFLNVAAMVQAPLFGYTYEHFMPLNQSGNVWTLIQSYANPCVNEMFVDVREITQEEINFRRFQESRIEGLLPANDARKQQDLRDQVQRAFQPEIQNVEAPRTTVALVLRQFPYDTEAFYQLPCIEIDETETKQLSIGRAGHEVYNFIRVRFSAVPQYQEFAYGILVQTGTLRAFGLKRLEVDTLYCFGDSVAGTSSKDTATSDGARIFDDVLDYYTGVLSAWNLCNEALHTGSWVGRFLPRVRVGMRAQITFYDEGVLRRLDAYIQGVQHSFSAQPGQSKTTLTLVRGIVVDLQQDAIGSTRELSMIWNEAGAGDTVRSAWSRLSANGDLVVKGQVVARSAQRR